MTTIKNIFKHSNRNAILQFVLFLAFFSAAGCQKAVKKDDALLKSLLAQQQLQKTKPAEPAVTISDKPVVLTSNVTIANNTNNPFLTPEERKQLASMPADKLFQKGITVLPHSQIDLSAIFLSSIATRSYAIVNGRIVRENDTIDEKQIVSIQKEELKLKDKTGQQYLLRLQKVY